MSSFKIRTIVLTLFVFSITLLGLTATSFAQSQPRAFDCATATDVSQTQCETLVALYNSTNGDSWTTKTNWLTSTAVCTWHGLTCSGGDVFTIFLINNNMTGTLPTFGSMPGLKEFTLSSNPITGSIPSSINGTNMPALTNLNFGSNQLSGTLPSSLATLPLITQIVAADNDITGPLPDLTDACDTLTSIGMYDNPIGGTWPVWLNGTTCPNLTYIGLYNTNLTGDFPDLTGMNLNSIYIGYNAFNDGPVPAWLVNMTTFYSIDISKTNRTGSIPVFAAPELGTLNISNNKLTGDLPAAYNSTTYPILQRLYISGLQISNFDDSFATLSGLTTLAVRWNKLKASELSSTVVNFLNTENANWATAQTTAPTYTASATNSTTISITGTGVSLGTTGLFEAMVSSTAGGPYTTVAASTNATTGAFTINLTGQTPASTVYIVVRSKSDPNNNNPNTLYSTNGAEVSVTLPENVDPTVKPTKPVLSYPGGFNDKVTGSKSPNFNWNLNPSGDGVTHYRLTVKKADGTVVFNKNFAVGDICTTFCLVRFSLQSPVVELANGPYTAQLTATNIIGSTKGDIVSFSMVKPTKPVLTAPVDGITLNDPTPTLTFTYNIMQSISNVKVTVTKSGATTPTYTESFAVATVCTTGTCTVILPTGLANGLYTWKAEIQNPNGKSASSDSFKIAFPDKASGLTPTANATIDTQKPSLSWNEVPDAAEYRVTVQHVTSGTKVVLGWAADGATGLTCDAGVCTLDMSVFTDAPSLKKGAHEWSVEARNTALSPSKSKSAVAKFKVVLPTRSTGEEALPLPPTTFRAP